MKMYILYVSFPYEGGYIHGVFSTREEAESYKKNYEYIPNSNHAHIEEVDINTFVQINI